MNKIQISLKRVVMDQGIEVSKILSFLVIEKIELTELNNTLY